MKRLLFLGVGVLVLILSPITSMAQCAMCRATLENNVSNGSIGIAAGINFGILYLFAAPYVVISLIAFFWFKSSRAKKNQVNEQSMAG
jgi:hypothetical protein